MYRIIRTERESPDWRGFCAVVTLKYGKVIMPLGQEYPYRWVYDKLCITKGPHRGRYNVERLESKFCTCI